MSDTFPEFHALAVNRVNSALEAVLDGLEAPERLREAMHYAVMNGGKRLRPTMAYAAFAAVSGHQLSITSPDFAAADAAAVALELIHSYSLVHDDLPAMDDDDLRRGKPSCHIAFDEATAILVGDALQTLALEHLSVSPALNDQQYRLLSTCLSKAAGATGMVGGQMLDLLALQVDDLISLPQLETLHRAKTGALICAALEMGALGAAARPDTIAGLRAYGGKLGLAFQVVDDVLDITASTEQLGKQQGSDQLLGKPTYPGLMGLEQAQDYALELCESAKEELQALPESSEVLLGLADFVSARSY